MYESTNDINFKCHCEVRCTSGPWQSRSVVGWLMAEAEIATAAKIKGAAAVEASALRRDDTDVIHYSYDIGMT